VTCSCLAPETPGLAPRIARWIACEQTVNERILDHRVFRRIDDGSNVKERFRPEHRGVWRQEMILLPESETRGYGLPRVALEEAFHLNLQADRSAIFLHPQSHGLYRERIAKEGVAPSDIFVTPTASYRSLLAWRETGTPVLLKVSLGAVLGRTKRALREVQIARGIVVSRLFDTIPLAHREHLKLDWFSERAGVVDKKKGHGWLLRTLPASMLSTEGTDLVPAFSLISRRPSEGPLLCDLIRQSGMPPEEFVVHHLILPYVNVLAYLLLEQGITVEGHTQNVLFEVAETGLTGKIALRDMSDFSVNLPLRIAKHKELPVFAPGYLPRRSPFPVACVASDHRTNARRPFIARAGDTVERYGLLGFVGAVNESMRRFFPRYRAEEVETRYLDLWQQAAVGYLAVKPLFRRKGRGMAIEEAVAHFLDHVDWSAMPGAMSARLPSKVEALLVGGRARRRKGRAYTRIPSSWGDLYIAGSHPAFFRPAF
jgi:IucA / IucC family